MPCRRGLGRGKGQGYKNLNRTLAHDKRVHTESRMGFKQPQKIPNLRFIKKPPFATSNSLPVQVGFIIPSTIKDKKISDEEFKKRIVEQKRYMSKIFGGDTSIKTIGSYWDGKKLITEDGVLVQSSMSVEKYNKEIKRVTAHIKKMRVKYGQDTILVKVEGQDFIIPKKSYIGHDRNQGKFILVS